MANQKVPQLPILSAVTGEDLFYVVDVSDTTDDPTGSSKQITRDDVLKNITGLTATTISATTYQNLPVDPNYYTTAFTYSNNVFTISQSGQSDLTATINSVTGWTVNGNLTVSGGTQSIFSGNSSSDLVRITQTGSGNAFVVEDDSNPDSTPFVIDANGNVGMGTLTPQNVLHIKSNPSSTSTAIIRLESAATSANSSISYWSASVNRWEVGTGVNLGLPYEIYDRVAGETRFAITTGGAATFLNGDVGIGTSTPITKLDVSGDTRISGGLTATTITATTISATTYYGSGTNLTGVVKGSGTANYLPKWTGTTGLGNSQIQDNGTNIGIGTSPGSDEKVSIFTVAIDASSALWVRNASSNNGSGIYAISDSGKGSQVGVAAFAQGHTTTGTSIGFQGFATNGLLGIGVYGQVGVSESNTMTTGIGGYFDARGDGEYSYPTNSYGLQVIDGTEGVDKILQSKTSDGKTNWVDPLTVQTAFNYGLANAIMTGNFLT